MNEKKSEKLARRLLDKPKSLELIKEGCKELGLPEVKQVAVVLIKKLPEKYKSRKLPKTKAGGAIYIASIMLGKRKTQREISDLLDVSTVSIRKTYKEIANELDLDIGI